jgi:hypothetical protein
MRVLLPRIPLPRLLLPHIPLGMRPQALPPSRVLPLEPVWWRLQRRTRQPTPLANRALIPKLSPFVA